MKNKKSIKVLLSVFAVILVVVLLLTAVGPQLVLKGARQPEVAESYAYSENFYNSYDEIRSHLKERVEKLQGNGVKVKVSEYAVDESDNLYIDNIYLPSEDDKENLIVLTTGVHGMEGYIGSVMLDVFFEELKDIIET